VEELVIENMARQFQVPKDSITLDTDVKSDLCGDSLDMLEALMQLESEFEITLPEEEDRGLGDCSIRHYVKVVTELLKQNGVTIS